MGQVLKNCPSAPLLLLLQVSQHRWSLAGTSASPPSQRWRQELTWEEVGGSRSWGWKPDIAMQMGLVVANVCSGPYCSSSSAGCGLLSTQPGLEHGFPSPLPKTLSWCFRAARWQGGDCGNPVSESQGYKPKAGKEKPVFPAKWKQINKPTEPLRSPFPLKSQVR